MKYATIRQDGVTELRQSPKMPQDGIALTDEQYEGLAQGSMILEAGAVVTNPNWPPVPDPADAIRQQLAALDAANPITQRNLRELTLALAQIIEMVTQQPAAANKGVQVATAVEAQAQVLRDQLKAIERASQ